MPAEKNFHSTVYSKFTKQGCTLEYASTVLQNIPQDCRFTALKNDGLALTIFSSCSARQPVELILVQLQYIKKWTKRLEHASLAVTKMILLVASIRHCVIFFFLFASGERLLQLSPIVVLESIVFKFINNHSLHNTPTM